MMTHTRNLLLVAVVLLFQGCVAQQLSDTAKLAYIKQAAGQLRKDVFNFWLKNGPDSPGLGFYGTVDQTGKSIDPKSKGLIQESRHLYAMVLYWQYYDRKGAKVAAAIDTLYQMLTSKFQDKSDQRFYYKVSSDGNSVVDPTKSLHANLYTIMALARMGRLMPGKAAAYSLALDSFKKWDSLTHDNGPNKGWAVNGVKDQDLMVHMTEALTELWLGRPNDVLLKSRLTEVVTLMVDKVLLGSGKGYSSKLYNAAWQPTGDDVTEFGHEMVCTWMLLNLSPTLTRANVISAEVAKGLQQRVIATAKYTLNKGWDAVNGGFWQVADGGGRVGSRQKVFWQQAEGLLGTYKLYQVTKKPAYLDKAYQTAKWVMDYQRDKVNGEWYWGVNADSKQPGQEWPYMWKGLEWKASYHTGRATVFLSRWTSNLSAV